MKWTADMRLEARANNEWMRRFIENPEQFAREFQTVEQYLRQLKRELRAADREKGKNAR